MPHRCQSATSMTGICRIKPLILWMRRLPECGFGSFKTPKQMKETEQRIRELDIILEEAVRGLRLGDAKQPAKKKKNS